MTSRLALICVASLLLSMRVAKTTKTMVRFVSQEFQRPTSLNRFGVAYFANETFVVIY